MFHEGWQRHIKWLHQFTYRCCAAAQALNDRSPRWVGKCVKDRIKRRTIVSHMANYRAGRSLCQWRTFSPNSGEAPLHSLSGRNGLGALHRVELARPTFYVSVAIKARYGRNVLKRIQVNERRQWVRHRQHRMNGQLELPATTKICGWLNAYPFGKPMSSDSI